MFGIQDAAVTEQVVIITRVPDSRAQKVSAEQVCAHGNASPFHRVSAGRGGVLLRGRRRTGEVASQGKQIKLDKLGFDWWQRAGYYRHREQPKKDTDAGEMCD